MGTMEGVVLSSSENITSSFDSLTGPAEPWA